MDDQLTISLDTGEDNEGALAERRDAAENRRLLLQTAAELFAIHGVAAVNMADIAKVAGVGKGTLYRRFANKGELCLSLLDEEFRQYQNKMLTQMRQMSAEDVPVLTQLAAVLNGAVRFAFENLGLMCEVDRAGVGPSHDFNAPHYWNEITFRGLLQAAVRAGELESNTNVAYIASACMALLNARTLRHQHEVQGFSIDEISEGMQALITERP